MTDSAAPSRQRLLRWYRANRRDLPWRGSKDPYRIWLSEIVLQQTRVEAGLPYYERLLERFPDLEALAAAPLEAVLACWSGLGYYRRARQLHAAAAELVARGGAFPTTAAGWLEMPGVGPYTAAAIASIVDGEVTPALDGNVLRLGSRLLALDIDPRSSAGRRCIAARAAELLEPADPGESNQALIELGARVCTPRRPDCPRCPLRPDCEAARSGDPQRYPPPRARRPPRRVRLCVAVVTDAGRVLLLRRPDDERLLAGTWELPAVEARRRDRIAAALAAKYGGAWRLDRPSGTVRHAITGRDLTVEVRRADLESVGTVAEGQEAGWFAAAEIEALPVSSLVGKALTVAARRRADTSRGSSRRSPAAASRRAGRAS